MAGSRIKYLFTFLSAAWIFCFDQASKIYIHTQFQRGDSQTVIEGFFNISYVRNPGGAFGLFGDSPDHVRAVLFLVFPLVCVGLIFMMLREAQNRFQVAALSFVLGGAAGNYLDRVRFGYVVDFIDWHFKGRHFPTFNIADSFIVVGVSILFFFYTRDLLQSWRLAKSDEKQISAAGK